MDQPEQFSPPAGSLRRILFRGLILVVAIGLVFWSMDRVMPEDAVQAFSNEGMGFGVLAVTLVVYAVFIALPFVPGIEIGATLLLLGGAAVAPFVYVATVFGLMLAYLAGRFLQYDWLHQFFADLRMRRVCGLLEELKPLSAGRRLALLRRRLPAWAAPIAIQGRYILLALLLVLPGNAVIGGGGGICLLAGLTRVYALPATLLTIGLAVLPVPLLVWALNWDVSGFF